MNSSNIEYIGYAENTGRAIVIILSILSVLVNMIFLLNFGFKLFRNAKNKLSSIEKLMLGLSIDEILISIFWVVSAIFFKDTNEILKKENICKKISCFEIYYYIFDWTLLSCTIYQIKRVILDPVDSVLKSNKKIICYFLLCFFFAFIWTLTSYLLDLNGESPMITCFFKITYNKEKRITILFLCSIPVLNIFFAIYQLIIILYSPQFHNDMENIQFLKNYSIYIGAYLISAFLIFILYLLDFFNPDEKTSFLRWFFCICTMLICSTPFTIGIIRLIQTKSYKYLFEKSKNKNISDLLIIENNIKSTFEEDDSKEFENFEKSSLKKFLKNIYLSISYCLYLNKESNNDNFIINQEKCLATNNYKIRKSIIEKNPFFKKEINERDNVEMSCIEFAPEIFNYLRQLDLINETIIESLLPSNNIEGLKNIKSIHKTEGRGGSFFINTDDKQFILKTINYQELELIRNLLLKKLALHFSNNKNSIIGRIYGLYKISIKIGVFIEKEIYLILMKNVFGPMSENLMCKYDLKGSELNREIEINDNEDIENEVMKDLNFLQIEKILLLNKHNSMKLNSIIERDASFLCECGVMDYSLLVCKIRLNNDEMISIFGIEHNSQSDIEIGLIKDNISIDDSNESFSIDINENKNNYDEKKLSFKIMDVKSIEKYIFPSLKATNLYIIAIIDFLQLYDFQKYIETQYKKMKTKENSISSIPPEPYKQRFIKFVKAITDQTTIFKNNI